MRRRLVPLRPLTFLGLCLGLVACVPGASTPGGGRGEDPDLGWIPSWELAISPGGGSGASAPFALRAWAETADEVFLGEIEDAEAGPDLTWKTFPDDPNSYLASRTRLSVRVRDPIDPAQRGSNASVLAHRAGCPRLVGPDGEVLREGAGEECATPEETLGSIQPGTCLLFFTREVDGEQAAFGMLRVDRQRGLVFFDPFATLNPTDYALVRSDILRDRGR